MYFRCYSTLGSAELNLEETLALAARHRLAAVELRALAGTIDLPAHFAAAYGTPAALAARVSAQPVRIPALGTSFKLAGHADGDREALLAFLPWAEALGGARLRVFDGGKPGDEAALRTMAETVAWWRGQRAINGWKSDLMVETHDALFTAATIRALLALAPGTGILWDSHHTWRKGGEDPMVTWRAIKPHVVHVHVKDSVNIPGKKHPFTYCLPGEGGFPMAPLREVLAAEYDGTVSLEWERFWHPDLPPVEEALRLAAARGWW